MQILIPDFAEAAAFLARAVRRIERKQTRIEFLEGAAATRATHLRAHDREPIFRIEQMRGAAADLERALDEIARFQNSLRIDRADDHIDRVLLETLEFSKLRDRNQLAIDIERVEALPLRPARDIGVKPFSRFDQRRQHLERAALRRRSTCFTIAARLCFSTGRSQSGQNCVPVLAKSSRRK